MKKSPISALIINGGDEIFDKKQPKYITRGVQSEISIELQMILWNMVSSVPYEKDYLQVFKLSCGVKDGKKMQVIKHSQEQPQYETIFTYFCDHPVNTKLYCIDDDDDNGGHSTLLLSEEY
jgi:hypothetical protein